MGDGQKDAHFVCRLMEDSNSNSLVPGSRATPGYRLTVNSRKLNSLVGRSKPDNCQAGPASTAELPRTAGVTPDIVPLRVEHNKPSVGTIMITQRPGGRL